MKVADLQQFVRSLVNPLQAAGASQKVVGELERAIAGLEPFAHSSLNDFAQFLELADQYVKTGTLPAKAGKATRSGTPRAAKAPKLSVEQAAQLMSTLYEKAIEPDMDYTRIDTEFAPIRSLTVKELVQVAQAVGLSLPARMKKDDVCKKLLLKVQERKENFDRTRDIYSGR
ncbi:MAG: hypothetical protein HY040_09120 [Planctomycetes bacterium]|nr:hypothetical protein [Planctomycetota bacterium]